MNRLKNAQYIALVATAFSVAGFLLGGFNGKTLSEALMVIGFLIGLVAYFFGGFLTAVKMSCSIAKFGWFIVPFPFDILTFIIALVYSIIVFVFIPIIPIRKAYKEQMKNSVPDVEE